MRMMMKCVMIILRMVSMMSLISMITLLILMIMVIDTDQGYHIRNIPAFKDGSNIVEDGAS